MGPLPLQAGIPGGPELLVVVLILLLLLAVPVAVLWLLIRVVSGPDDGLAERVAALEERVDRLEGEERSD